MPKTGSVTVQKCGPHKPGDQAEGALPYDIGIKDAAEDRMKRFWAMVLLFVGIVMSSHLGFAKDHAYTQGKLLDASVDERVKQGSTQARVIYVVQVADIVYTVQGEQVKAGTKDYTRGLIIGDPVQASVDGDHVYLRTEKGKEIKTNVLKRARAQTP